MNQDTAIRGLHHITLVTRDAQKTVDFYTQTLGMRFVKKTVNFDRPDTYHFYFGDDVGTPGSVVTFFVWPDARDGEAGIGVTQHFALTVETDEAQLKWKRYLTDRGIPVIGPYDHHAYHSIIFDDPCGVLVEIATRGPGWSSLPHDGSYYVPNIKTEAPFRNEQAIDSRTWPEPVPTITPDMRLGPLHHVSPVSSDLGRTNAFMEDVLGIPLLLKAVDDDDPEAERWHWGVDEGRAGTITYYHVDPARWGGNPPRGKIGAGITHHIALAVADDAALGAWHERLRGRGIEVTEILNRVYFHSIYFDDPDGQILEIATVQPGFLVDQPQNRLGKDLALPPWLEGRRAEIEATLPPVTIRATAVAG